MSTCPACAAAVVAGASFCEACGAGLDGLAEGPTCGECGTRATEDSDGYCAVCGHRLPGPRDHLAIDLATAAGVTDRGRRHHHNEDAMAVALIENGSAIVVCDGVSTTANSELASQAAADAALDALTRPGVEPAQAMLEAAAAARRAVAGVPSAGPGAGNPSCTFVAALVQADDVTVGWLGDSRAYWLGPDPRLLTSDHTWAAEVAASGEMTIEQAVADPRGGSITRWIGVDAPDIEPSVARFSFDAGVLLVCSDGLWNYAPDAATLATHPALHERELIEQAGALVRFANESGGHDNITVVLSQVGAMPATSLGSAAQA